jgi:hypothetical protein
MRIKNAAQLDTWLFEHAQIQGHECFSFKRADGLNAAWIDQETGERFEIEYEASNES